MNKLIKYSFFFELRRYLLRFFGIRVGKKSAIHSDVFFYDFGKLTIGANCTLNRFCIIDNRGGLHIGNNVNISHSCQIFTQSHDLSLAGAPIKNSRVVIGDDVWIFPNVRIMPGVTVKRGAVIYPCSVVVKDVDEYEVVGGYPAKHISFRDKEVSWDIDNRIHFSL